MNSVAHAYRYLQVSHLQQIDRGFQLSLASSGPGLSQAETHPHFFEGRLLQPRLSAELLSTVHRVVASRFFVPANTLAKTLALADPVVTAGGQMLRFEGFSGCCSCYARADLLPESYDGQIVGKGTTNVDFNAPMRAALARVREADDLSLSVEADRLSLRSGGHEVIERKVELPLRWIRGMLEAQSYLASMSRRFEVKGLEAMRFMRSLPKTSTSHTPLWVISGPAGLACTTREQASGVRIADAFRCVLMQALRSRHQTGLQIGHSTEHDQRRGSLTGFPDKGRAPAAARISPRPFNDRRIVCTAHRTPCGISGGKNRTRFGRAGPGAIAFGACPRPEPDRGRAPTGGYADDPSAASRLGR